MKTPRFLVTREIPEPGPSILDDAGDVEIRDGMRSRFDAPVGPGQTVEVTARVLAPPRGGRWVLEWEMVREQVAWSLGPRL